MNQTTTHSPSIHPQFRFCPICSSQLSTVDQDGIPRLACSSNDCEFIHYRNPAPAAGIVLVEENQILLVRRAHHPKIGFWSLPAGFMEWEEHPSQTAVREAKEETGLDVDLTRLFDIYTGQDDPRTHAVLVLYEAQRRSGTLTAGDDASEVQFFSLIDLPEQIAFYSHRQALQDYLKRYCS